VFPILRSCAATYIDRVNAWIGAAIGIEQAQQATYSRVMVGQVVGSLLRRVAVFGNSGGGKSTLARQLAEVTGLPLYALDVIQFPGGRYQRAETSRGRMSTDDYVRLHADILGRDRWIIEGDVSMAMAWDRLAVADTLVYLDLPLRSHYWGVTKRLWASQFGTPVGLPENTPMWASTLLCFRVIRQCHRYWTPRCRSLVTDLASTKRVHHLTSRSAIDAFMSEVRLEQAGCAK
jgi:adenylate kinase family enzyme